MTLHCAKPTFWAYAGLLLALLAPEMAWAQQRNSEAPPPSATILSVTDLPDRATPGKPSRRKRAVGRKKGTRGNLSIAQRRRQQILAQQKTKRLALANRRALTLKNEQAALEKANAAKAKASQLAQKANQKQTEIAQKTALPTLDTSVLKSSQPSSESAPPKSSAVVPPIVGKTQIAQGGTPTATQPNSALKNEVKGSPKSATPPPTTTRATPITKPDAGKPVIGATTAKPPVTKPLETKPADASLNDNLFKNTKPDIAQPRENSPVSGGNMAQNALALLLVSGAIYGFVSLMKRQMHKGDTPLARQLAKQSAAPPKKRSVFDGMFGSASAKRAAPTADANIRLIESLPTGNNTFIHLVEVQGKQFVVGATPWQLSMLTEIHDGNENDPAFMDALRSASAELDKLGLIDTPDSKLGMSAIDSRLNDAKEAVVHNTERVRSLRDQARRS